MKNSSQKNFHWHVNDRLDLSKPSGEDGLAISKLFEPDEDGWAISKLFEPDDDGPAISKLFEPDDDGPAIGLDDDRPDVSELSGVDRPAASDLFEDEDGCLRRMMMGRLEASCLIWMRMCRRSLAHLMRMCGRSFAYSLSFFIF